MIENRTRSMLLLSWEHSSSRAAARRPRHQVSRWAQAQVDRQQSSLQHRRLLMAICRRLTQPRSVDRSVDWLQQVHLRPGHHLAPVSISWILPRATLQRFQKERNDDMARYYQHPTVRPIRRPWFCLFLCLVLLVALAGCGRTESGGLNVSGSTSVAPFVEHLAEIYQRQHPGDAINVQSLGSSAGIQAAISGVAEIGMSSRELDADESGQLDQLLIARDALAVVVHPSNALKNLDLAQVQDIFGGKITSWAELGGPAQPITLIVREAGSGTFSAFEELVMEGKPITPSALRQGSNGAIRQLVSLDPYAIGYISLGLVDQTVKALAINNVQPSVEHVEAGTYTFVRPFLFVWRKGDQRGPLASRFVEYVMSPEAQTELADLGLIKATAPR